MLLVNTSVVPTSVCPDYFIQVCKEGMIDLPVDIAWEIGNIKYGKNRNKCFR